MELKDAYERLRTIIQEQDELKESMKDLTKEIKDAGLPATKLKKLARIDVNGTWQDMQKTHKELIELAEAVDVA